MQRISPFLLLQPQLYSGHGLLPCAASTARLSRAIPPWNFATQQKVLKSCQSGNKRQCNREPVETAIPPLTSSRFWNSTPVWRRAAVNTFRCLIGCTAGDFSAMWYFQAFHPGLGIPTIMIISMASGITTSMLLETTLLRIGRDCLPWLAAAKTAAGMSTISMVTMELAENAVDYHFTGGLVQLDSPAFWGAALLSVSAGFLAPLPYNYLRLKKYGKACH